MNENKNRRRIKSVLPSDYNSNVNFKSTSPLEMAERAEKTDVGERVNSAYDTI